jgi:hypothetical protein
MLALFTGSVAAAVVGFLVVLSHVDHEQIVKRASADSSGVVVDNALSIVLCAAGPLDCITLLPKAAVRMDNAAVRDHQGRIIFRFFVFVGKRRCELRFGNLEKPSCHHRCSVNLKCSR